MELEDGEIAPTTVSSLSLAAAASAASAAAVDETGSTKSDNAGENEQSPGAAPVVTAWATVTRCASSDRVRSLFGSSQRHSADGTQCSDPGFVKLATLRHKELYGVEPPLSRLPIKFLRYCYLEYFGKRIVDYAAVTRSHEHHTENHRRRRAARVAAKKIASTSAAAAAKSLSLPFRDVPKRPRTSGKANDLIMPRLKLTIKELRLAEIRCRELEERVKEAEEIKSRARSGGNGGGRSYNPRMVPTPLEELRGRPLGSGFSEEEKRKECPVCFARFSSEGWYRLGSCGHEYHLQCLMLHALCACSCAVCDSEIPLEFYKGIGQEDHRPA
ncbi:hypothetical protein SELMODRAFT_403454 [Selaginella moellendorffii]|uniref:RING-type domain-containing protein n=1 Tax=Selaginella moellendorffii TaxID=88036 RepID=D8QRG6_SELML|nr:hypothetical protein SELMODRAFT_403454 [Selaginella moellendorffii]